MKKIFLLLVVVSIGNAIMAQDTSKATQRKNPNSFDTFPPGKDSTNYKKWKNDKMPKDKRKNKIPDTTTTKTIDSLKLQN